MKGKKISQIETCVPGELKNINNWVLYKAEKTGDRVSKPPYQVNGRLADPTNRNHWASYEKVLEVYKKSDEFAGIGFVFEEAAGYVGIDMDDVIDEDGTLNEEAGRLIEGLNSYTEISPSGKGIHIIVRTNGQAIVSGKAKPYSFKSLEMYANKHYFTITGDVYNNYITISNIPCSVCDKISLMEYYNITLNKKDTSMMVHKQSDKSDNTYKTKDLKNVVSLEENAKQVMIELEKEEKYLMLFNGFYKRLKYPSKSEADMGLCRIVANRKRDAEIIDYIFRKSKLYNSKWDKMHSAVGKTYGEVTIDKVLGSINSKDNKWHDIEATDNSCIETIQSEWHISKVITEMLGDKIKATGEKEWLLYNGKINKWEKTDSSVIANLFGEAISTLAPKEDKEYFYNRNMSFKTIKNIMELYRGNCNVRVENMAKNYIRANNIFVDLKKGCSDNAYNTYDSRFMNIKYVREARAPLWEKYISEVMGGDKEKIEYIKRAVGYAFTGCTNEQIIFFLVGAGGNGKSVFARVLSAIAGSDYAKQVPFSTLTANKFSEKEYDLAYLEGARIVFSSEIDDDFRISEAKIKILTGEDKVTARHLYQEYYEYTPEYTIFFLANKFPEIKSKNNGIWRRVVIIPFEKSFKEKEKDRELTNKLMKEAEGILQWIIEGATAWYKQGLKPPKGISDAVMEYRKYEDTIYFFMKEKVKEEKGAFVLTEQLYSEYKKWLADNGEASLAINQNMFSKEIKEKGYKKQQRRNGNKCLRGFSDIKIKE